MTSNISSRTVSLIIGSQNWSNWIEAGSGIQVGYPEYQVGSGLKPVEGTVTLEFSAYDPSLPSSPHPLLNPSQWQREQVLSIEVVNDAGTFEALPCSGQLLYILKAPQAPKRSLNGLQQISFSVGCRLALEYFPPEPNKDVSGVIAGTPLDRGTIITNILSFIGVPSAIGSIPYPIDYPLPKIEGNWIQMCGELASTAGYYLRCNVAGVVIAEPINLLPTSSVRNYAIGQDEEFWQPSGDTSEQPLEKLIVSGVKQIASPVDTEAQVTIEQESLGVTYPDVFGQAGPGFSSAVQIFRKTTKSFKKITETLFEESVFIEEALGVTYPDVFGQAGPGFSSALQGKARSTTQYFLINGICYKTLLKEEESLGVTYPDVFGQAGPGFSSAVQTKRRTAKEWIKIKDGLWGLTTNIEESLGLTYPDVFGQAGSGFSSAVQPLSEITTPDTSGPPTNFGDLGENFIKEEPIKAEIFAEQLAPTKNRDRQNTINLPYAISIGQLQAYGENFNRFLSGRASGYQFSGKIEWLTPFNQVSVTDGAIVYFMKVDGLQWAINQIKASTLWYGIVSGFANAETPEDIIRPVEISLGEFVVQAISDCYILFAEILESEALVISDSYIIPTIVWGNVSAISDCYIINNPVISSIYKAYWSFESISSGFSPNALGDSDYDLPVSAGFTDTGKVGNAAYNLAASLSTSVPDPFFNFRSNDFVGFAVWIFPETSGSGTVSFLGNPYIGFFNWKLSVNFGTAQITLTTTFVGEEDSETITVSTGINIDTWNLVICEMSKPTASISIKVNNGTKQTNSTALVPRTFPSSLPLSILANDINIDELFFFSEPLDSGQESAIWNSGSGSAYPPF